MKKSTEELLLTLHTTASVCEYLKSEKENLFTLPLSDALDVLLETKKISKGSCIRNANLDRTYCYQIFSGTKKPSRDKLLALCVGMKLTVNEVQQFFRQTGYAPLYPRNQRDSVILFGLAHQLAIDEINHMLFELSMELLQ